MIPFKDIMPDFTDANCRGIDTDLFYPPETGAHSETQMAKRVCKACVIKDECLAWALKYEHHGIWGGTTPNQRKRLRRSMRVRAYGYVSEA